MAIRKNQADWQKNGRVPARQGHGQHYVFLRAETIGKTRPEGGRKHDRVPRRARGYQTDGQGWSAEGPDRPGAPSQPERRPKYADSDDMSPKPPIAQRRAHPATDGIAGWIDAIPEGDLAVPRRQRHTARRIFDRAVAEKGYSGSYSSVRKHVAAWKKERLQGPRNGFLELVWAPGTAQADFGNFVASIAGLAVPPKLLVVVLPHSSSRFCMALPCERAEVFCWGLHSVFEWIGRLPRLLVPGNATAAGRMLSSRVTELCLVKPVCGLKLFVLKSPTWSLSKTSGLSSLMKS